LATPLLTVIVLETAEVRMLEVSFGIIAAVAVAAFGRAVAFGLLAPDSPQRRLVPLGDAHARLLAGALVWGMRALGILILALAVHRALATPPALTLVTDMLFALVIGALLAHLLWSGRHDMWAEGGPWWMRGLNVLGWGLVAVIALALVAGYPTQAMWIAVRLVSLAAVGGALVLLRALAEELLADRLAVDTPRGQALAASFGIEPRWLGLAAILALIGMSVASAMAAFVLYAGPW
jgi:potassium-dependent mechanosensitive channel